MLRPLSRDEVRSIDRAATQDCGLPSLVLMENAGRGAAELLVELGIDGPVEVIAGRGNNGGDGMVLARHLDCAGYQVRVWLCGERQQLKGDPALHWQVLQQAGVACRQWSEDEDWELLTGGLEQAAWIVDGLLGTGTRGEIHPPVATIIERINGLARPVLALDLPSGLDCDSGQPLGICIRARHTATFVAPKLGFDSPEAVPYTGHVHVVGIGAPRKLLEAYASTRS